ncbi:MAG: hypothetical protein IPK07_06880 [Deltaproteobacteria bacterium]|nr:hypothetical protein [Deltaproteobacteria bacterium]
MTSGDAQWVTPATAGLSTFGDEHYFAFSLAAPAQVGIGFDDQGIGDGNNLVRVFPATSLDAAIPRPLRHGRARDRATGERRR